MAELRKHPSFHRSDKLKLQLQLLQKFTKTQGHDCHINTGHDDDFFFCFAEAEHIIEQCTSILHRNPQ